MDRDGRGKPPPGEFSSFDLSKMSEAEVAAELAARMARWRSAHKRPNGGPDKGTREPPAGNPAARPTAPQPSTPPQQSTAEPSVPPREAGVAIAARIDRARRVAAQVRWARGRMRSARQAPPYGTAFESLLAEGPNMNAIGMRAEDGADQAPPREWPPGVGAQAANAGSWRAMVRRVLQARIEEAQRHARAIGASTQEAGIVAWRKLKPALEARVDQALTRSRATGAMLRDAMVAAWRALKSALEASVHQALKHTRAVGMVAQSAIITVWRASEPVLETSIDQARHYARVIAAAVWQARTDRFAVAGFAAIAVAIAAWLLILSDQPAPPDVARSQETEYPRGTTGASAATELSQIPRPIEIARPPQPPSAPDVAVPGAGSDMDPTPLPAKLKPAPHVPTLTVRLKPGTPQPATPSAAPQSAIDPQSPTPLNAAPPTRHPQQTTDEPSERADPRATDRLLDQMFSDGLGHSLSRQ